MAYFNFTYAIYQYYCPLLLVHLCYCSGNILHCCLWDDHAKQCADEFTKFDGIQPQPYVILVKHARVKPEACTYVFVNLFKYSHLRDSTNW